MSQNTSRLVERMAGHGMFARPGRLDIIKMCEDCRVIVQFEDNRAIWRRRSHAVLADYIIGTHNLVFKHSLKLQLSRRNDSDVVSLFMALPSSVESHPKPIAQGEQRRFSYFNIDRDNSLLNLVANSGLQVVA